MSQVITYGNPAADPHSTGTVKASLTSGSGPQQVGPFAWIMAFVVLGAFVFLLNKSRAGHTLLYYGICLLILVTLVTQYQFVTDALAPLTMGKSLNAPGKPAVAGTEGTT